MKKTAKLFALFLALCILIPSAVSCGTSKDSDGETTEETTVETGLMDIYEKDKYPNKEFKVYTIEGMYADLSNGADVVSTALFRRDDDIKNYFGIDITYGYFPNNDTKAIEALSLDVESGENAYNCYITSSKRLVSIAVRGMLEDLNSVENLDLSNKWWSQIFNEGCDFRGKQYAAAGPFSELYYHSAICLAMNNELANDLHLPNIVDMVNNGTWTLEEMNKLAKIAGVVNDNNGDGVMDNRDNYLFTAYDALAYGFFASAGTEFSTYDSNGDIKIELSGERSVNTVSEIVKTVNSTYGFFSGHKDAEDMFINSQSLFMYNSSGYMIDRLPSSPLDYSIIPCPKYNTDQEKYITCAWPNSNYCVGIPMGQSENDVGFTGQILEAYCHLSHVYVRPAKYDTVVKYKLSINEETTKMLDLIFDGLYFDLNLIFDFGGSRSIIANTIQSGNTGSMQSSLNRAKKLIDADIQKLIGVSES